MKEKHGDLVGNTYGRLIVLSKAGKDKTNHKQWLCRCECGKEKVIKNYGLVSGDTKSCGCLQAETVSKMKKTHGMARTPEYRAYMAMQQRCYNSKEESYKDYGARGITVCDRWLESFENFIADMGKRPAGRYTIERVDNEKGYSPDNCIWADYRTQLLNRRNTYRIEVDGKLVAATSLRTNTDMSNQAFLHRIKKGWTVDEANNTPKLERKPRGIYHV